MRCLTNTRALSVQATDTRHYLIKPPLARRTDSAFGLPVAELDERASVVVGPEGVEQR